MALIGSHLPGGVNRCALLESSSVLHQVAGRAYHGHLILFRSCTGVSWRRCSQLFCCSPVQSNSSSFEELVAITLQRLQAKVAIKVHRAWRAAFFKLDHDFPLATDGLACAKDSQAVRNYAPVHCIAEHVCYGPLLTIRLRATVHQPSLPRPAAAHAATRTPGNFGRRQSPSV